MTGFWYGQRVGYYTGLAEGLVLQRRSRQMTEGEQQEVYEIIEQYLPGLRRYFAHYRPRTKK